MQSLKLLLDEYAASHTHRSNKLIHWICVPLIVWCVIALLWSLPFPSGPRPTVFANWATVALVLAQVYYFRLSVRLGTGVLLYNLVMLWLTARLAEVAPWPLWQMATVVFALAWAGQFIGHFIEGKRPSFFKDLQFLLIGPAWLMSSVYRVLGLAY